MNCPKCNKKMILRKPKPGQNWKQFWGCSGFPKCKTAAPYSQNSRSLKSIDKPNHRQDAIFKSVDELLTNGKTSDGKLHLIANAGPGTGKTATSEHVTGLTKKYDPNLSIIYLVFNKHVEVEAVSKGLPARTTHSFYYEQLRKFVGHKIKIDKDKVNKIVKSFVWEKWDEEKHLINPVVQIVSKVKNTCAPDDDQTLSKICDRFGIETNGSEARIFELVRWTIARNNEDLHTIDLDDQLYLTWKLNAPIEQKDWVLLDEAQDFNRVQIELVKRTVGKHILIVGDENQSMYQFRGAALDAMQQLQDAFEAHSLPLDITYRCPKKHVALINQEFPNISFIAHDEAIEGEINQYSYDTFLGKLKPDDLVLCRVNAPLVKPAFSLIRQGRKAIIRGRDIGKNLVALIEKFNENKVIDLLEKLIEYQSVEVAKLLKLEKHSQAQTLDDKIMTIIIAISEGCNYTSEIVRKITEVFQDNKAGVVFSSIHKAKGDEADNVFILQSELLPHPLAEAEWELKQEDNIKLVALTRSLKTLNFVGAHGFHLTEDLWAQLEEDVEKKLESKDESNILKEMNILGYPDEDDQDELETRTPQFVSMSAQEFNEKQETWVAPIIGKVPF